MKKIVFIFVLVQFMIHASSAQVAGSKVLVRNAGVVDGRQTISVKWYDQELFYPEGVNIYRKEGKGEWQKLNSKPVKRSDNVTQADYASDEDLHFFVPLINEGKKEQLQGLIFINILIKTFESEIFSGFLGIQYDDSTVKAGQTYVYKVNKVKGTSEYLIAESLPLVAGAETIEAPLKNVSVNADTARVLMKWRTEPQRFYAVNIYKETSSDQWVKLNQTPVLVSAYKDSLGRMQYPKVYFMDDSLSPGQYSYQLAGVDFFGKETRRSETFKVEVKDLIPPPAPEDLKDSVHNLTVVLRWKNTMSKDITGIHVYRSTRSGGPFIKLNSNLLPIIADSYTDKVEKAGPYYYYVSSVDAAGNEGRSDMIFSEVHDIVPPLKPSGLTARADTGKIHLNWQMNTEADLMGYRIFRTINKDDKNNFVLLNSEPLKVNFFTDHLPENAKNKFLYKVIAIDSSYNKSEYSEPVSVRMPDIIPPVKPLLKRVNNMGNSIVIAWVSNKDADLEGYDLYRSSDRSGFLKINEKLIPLSESSFTDRTVESAAHYFYYLIAVDSAGNASQRSNTIEGYNNYGKTSPVKIDVKVKYREDKEYVHVGWEVTGTDQDLKYMIYKKQDDHKQMTPLTGGVKNNEYYDKEVKPGNSYYYEVRAVDKAGNITNSETVKIRINQ